jgi:coenzyme F420-0:L-glutamate ligase / coenzyme F420-1:gamma-L-glutamate ligase
MSGRGARAEGRGANARIEVLPVEGLPEIENGDRLGAMVAERAGLRDGDIVVVAQKAVSKAEGRVRRLGEVEPSPKARELASALAKDPALVHLVLAESRSVIRADRGVLIVETTSGWICANAGIDASNVRGDDAVTLLPTDPDASARRIRSEIGERCGRTPAVVVSDSFGRPWRLGQADVAIGCAGLAALDDWRGRRDRAGRELSATVVAVADEVAAAADLARDKAVGVPALVVRGLERLVTPQDGPGAAAIRRRESDDLFR